MTDKKQLNLFPRLIPKTKQELANEFELSRNTIATYCKRIGIQTKGCRLSPKEVKLFYNHYGAVGFYEEG